MNTGKIYTKKGDKGTTKTLQGAMSKGDQLAVALGTVDELNSWVGLCRSMVVHDNRFQKVELELRRIQNNLLIIGSGLAGSTKVLGKLETKHLEVVIDTLTTDLPELKNFIFPTGIGVAAYLQVARTVARRAEREVTRVHDSVHWKVSDPSIKKYLNRLSDAFFTLGRWSNMVLGGKDEVWK